MITYTRIASPLGPLLLAATEQGIRGVYFDQHRYPPRMEAWREHDAHPLLRSLTLQLEEFFAGKRERFTLPLDLVGTPFQCAVWQALQELPFGARSTYRAIATQVGKPAAVRAVGTAIGRNPVSIVVPCHRVVGSDGSLHGYAGGLTRKQSLLELETRCRAS